MLKLTLVALGAAIALHGEQAKLAVSSVLTALGAEIH